MPALRIAFFYAALFLGLGGTFAFLPVWYQGRGLSAEMIGYALGAGAFARFLAGPLVAAQAGHPSHLPRILQLSSLAAFAIYILHWPISSPVVFVLLALALGTAYAPLVPLTDALAMSKERRGLLHYGPVRSAGSAAFIIGNLVCGWLIGKSGSDSLLYWAIGAGLLLVMAGFMLPTITREEKQDEPDHANRRLQDAFLFSLRPDIALVLLVTFLIQLSHSFFYGFSALIWIEAGITGSIIGALFAWGVFFEIGVFGLSPWFRKHISPLVILSIGGTAALIRWLALSTQPDLLPLLGWQVLHGFSAAMTNLGMMAYLQQYAPERLLPGMQAINSSLNAGLAFGIGFAIAGILYEAQGAGGYLIAASVALTGLIICLGLLFWQRIHPPSRG